MQYSTVQQFYSRLRADTQLGTEMSPQYLAMYDRWQQVFLRAMNIIFYICYCCSLVAGESTYHSSDAKMLRLKLLKVAENIDLMSKKIQQVLLILIYDWSTILIYDWLIVTILSCDWMIFTILICDWLQLGTDNLPEGAARPRRLALQDQVCAFCRSNTSHLTRVLLTTTRCGGPR